MSMAEGEHGAQDQSLLSRKLSRRTLIKGAVGAGIVAGATALGLDRPEIRAAQSNMVLEVDTEYGRLTPEEKREQVQANIKLFQNAEKTQLLEIFQPVDYEMKSGAPAGDPLQYVATGVFSIGESDFRGLRHFMAKTDDQSEVYPMLGPIEVPHLKEDNSGAPDIIFWKKSMYLGRTEHPFVYVNGKGEEVAAMADVGYFGVCFGEEEDKGQPDRRPVVPGFLGWRTGDEGSSMGGGILVKEIDGGRTVVDEFPAPDWIPQHEKLALLDNNILNGLVQSQIGGVDNSKQIEKLAKQYGFPPIYSQEELRQNDLVTMGLYADLLERGLTCASEDRDVSVYSWEGSWREITVEEALSQARMDLERNKPAGVELPRFPDYQKYLNMQEITEQDMVSLPLTFPNEIHPRSVSLQDNQSPVSAQG